MKLAKEFGCGASVLSLFAVVFGGCWLVNRSGRNFERLLRGDNQVAVVSVRISGQNQLIELADPESMQYLTLAFLAAQKDGYIPVHIGATYSAEMRLSPGGTVTIGFYVPGDADGLTVSYPLDSFDDPTYYWVPFSKPMPGPVSTAIERMRNPQRLTGGNSPSQG
jgi:hypothetical protein